MVSAKQRQHMINWIRNRTPSSQAYRRQIRSALLLRPGNLRRHMLVRGLHVLRKRQILQRVLVAAVNLRIVRQRRQLLHQSRVHLLGVTLEKSTATGQKQSVAGEHAALVIGTLHIVANVPGRVARREQATHAQFAHRQHVIVTDFVRQRADAIVAAVHGQLGGARIGGTELGDELLVAARMIPMVVGGQDAGQLNIVLLDGGQHGFGVDGIDDGRRFGGVVDQLAARNREYICLCVKVLNPRLNLKCWLCM